jgi:ribosomal protein L20
MHALRTANIGLDRKVLSDIATLDPGGFEGIVKAIGGAKA